MISHKYKIIFLHIPRTGGSSLELALVNKDWYHVDPKTKHLDYKEAKELYSEYWDDYLKISIVRNTWDWLVSLFFSHKKYRAKNKTWEQFITNPNLAINEQKNVIQSQIIGTDIDFILKFSSLQEDFNNLCNLIKIKPFNLPHKNQIKHKFYRKYYTNSQIEFVRNYFNEDIMRFNFKF